MTTPRTTVLSSFEAYLESTNDSSHEQADQKAERQNRLLSFPYPVMLELAFPEVDFANRWCWQVFGSHHGECFDKSSEYSVCKLKFPHSHIGTWSNYWFVKTDYNFGFAEWYFSTESDRDQFIDFVPSINWGENYSE